MTAVLVTLADFKSYLKYDKNDEDVVLQALLDAVEAHLADLTDQTFAVGGAVADEEHSGDGGINLFLRRPASAITSVKVSRARDFGNPDVTIPATDLLVDPTNAQCIVRFQNGVFPRGTFNLAATYTAAANTPEVAIEAVKEGAALLWRIRGSEHVRSQSLGDLGSEVLEVDRRLWGLPMWRGAVEQLQKPTMILA